MVGTLSKIFLLLWCFYLVESIYGPPPYMQPRHHQHYRPSYHRHSEEFGRGPYIKRERGPYKKRPSYHETSENYYQNGHRHRYSNDKYGLGNFDSEF